MERILTLSWDWLLALGLDLVSLKLNYGVALLRSGFFTIVQLEIYAAVVAVLVTAWSLWLRWGKGAANEA